jgi:hypothetical protein
LRERSGSSGAAQRLEDAASARSIIHGLQPGHWSWSGGQYVWIGGQYAERPNPAVNWVPGYWQQGPAGWTWIEGRWA